MILLQFENYNVQENFCSCNCNFDKACVCSE